MTREVMICEVERIITESGNTPSPSITERLGRWPRHRHSHMVGRSNAPEHGAASSIGNERNQGRSRRGYLHLRDERTDEWGDRLRSM
jgi:hypothetical protein